MPFDDDLDEEDAPHEDDTSVMQPRPAAPPEAPRLASRLLVWLIEGCAQVPRSHGIALRFFDARTLASCVRCGRGREPLAHHIGSRYCRRCVRVVLRHHLRAEHRASSAAHES